MPNKQNVAPLFDIEDTNIMSQNVEYTREALKKYLDTPPIKSQKQVAKAIGFCSATLSGFLNGSYKGDMGEVSNRVMNYLRLENQRRVAPKKPEFVETIFAKQVIQVANYARINRDMAMIHGDAGIGKTKALEHFAAKHSDVIMITAGPYVKTPKALLYLLSQKLGCKIGSNFGMGEEIISALKGTGWLIIIDEATHLNDQAKELMRSIHDQAKVGVLYCGTHNLYKQIYFSNSGFAQIISRIGIRCGLNRKDIGLDTIKLIFEQNGQLDSECLDYLHKKALGPGGLRYAEKLFVLASTLSYEENRNLGMKDLQEAHEMLLAQKNEDSL